MRDVQPAELPPAELPPAVPPQAAEVEVEAVEPPAVHAAEHLLLNTAPPLPPAAPEEEEEEVLPELAEVPAALTAPPMPPPKLAQQRPPAAAEPEVEPVLKLRQPNGYPRAGGGAGAPKPSPAHSYRPPSKSPKHRPGSAPPRAPAPAESRVPGGNLLPPFTKLGRPEPTEEDEDDFFLTQQGLTESNAAKHRSAPPLPPRAGGPPAHARPVIPELDMQPPQQPPLQPPQPPPEPPPVAEALDEGQVLLGARLLHKLKSDASSAQAAAYGAGGELSPRMGAQSGTHAPTDVVPPMHRGVSATFMAAMEVFLAESGIAGETTLAELRRGGGPPPRPPDDGLPEWAKGSGVSAGNVPGVGDADLPDVQQPVSLASLTAHTGLSLVESVLMVAKREQADVSALFRPVRSLFVSAEESICVSRLPRDDNRLCFDIRDDFVRPSRATRERDCA